MFFLGLLSTPLPYLLLAAFYFFGFAMGMFNNSTGDEATEATASVTIAAEVKQITNDQNTFYYQAYMDNFQSQADGITAENQTSSFSSDTGRIIYHFRNVKVHEFLFSSFQFSRPPPSVC
ncbi:MAG: hypothetical protein Q8N05_02585 [Bacteroidota bacterium]|nr:hypothetical protein [Bacteroidota bacterium]